MSLSIQGLYLTGEELVATELEEMTEVYFLLDNNGCHNTEDASGNTNVSGLVFVFSTSLHLWSYVPVCFFFSLYFAFSRLLCALALKPWMLEYVFLQANKKKREEKKTEAEEASGNLFFCSFFLFWFIFVSVSFKVENASVCVRVCTCFSVPIATE